MARSGGMSALCRGMLLRTMFGQTSNVPLDLPAEVWLALARSTIGPETPGYALDEPKDSEDAETGATIESEYGRQRILMGPASAAWIESSLSSVVNASSVQFPTAGNSWGTLKFWALMDSEFSGRVLVYGSLAEKYTVLAGDTVTVNPGAIRIGLDSYDMEW